MREMRKHACWYVKGMNGAARLREQLVRINTLAELDELLEGLRATCK